MNDQNQNGAIRLQSSAIVVAALITTSGAVIAACIQTGLIGRPYDPPLAVSMAAPTLGPVQATFTGAIEPLEEYRGGQVQQVAATTVGKIVIEPAPASLASTFPVPAYSKSILPAPALLPSEEIAKPEGPTKTLISPWAYLRGATTVDASADAAKSKKKPFDWNAVTRYFRGNN